MIIINLPCFAELHFALQTWSGVNPGGFWLDLQETFRRLAGVIWDPKTIQSSATRLSKPTRKLFSGEDFPLKLMIKAALKLLKAWRGTTRTIINILTFSVCPEWLNLVYVNKDSESCCTLNAHLHHFHNGNCFKNIYQDFSAALCWRCIIQKLLELKPFFLIFKNKSCMFLHVWCWFIDFVEINKHSSAPYETCSRCSRWTFHPYINWMM